MYEYGVFSPPEPDDSSATGANSVLASMAVLFIVASAAFTWDVFSPHPTLRSSTNGGEILLVAMAVAFDIISIAILCAVGRRWMLVERRMRDEEKAASLSQRAARATTALLEATGLVNEPQKELDARTALLGEQEQRIHDLEHRAEADPDTTDAPNECIGDVARLIGEFESRAVRREWLFGTLGGLVVGVSAILLTHFIFGY